jgi:hypothetical protein
LAESRETFENLTLEDSNDAIEMFAKNLLSIAKNPSTHGQRRFARLLCDVGRELERRDSLSLAIVCFKASEIPPSRERVARILLKQKKTEEAIAFAEQIALSPLEIQEEQFASTFIRKLKKNNSRASAWCGILGLALWEPLFCAQPGAFIHPFQDAPTDVGHPHFYLQRKELIDSALQGVVKHPDSILCTFDAKQNIANRFVNWRFLTREMVALAVTTIPASVLVAILSRMARNPFRYTSGFPDLFVVLDGKPEFWEVKGPGDSVRPEQDFWIREMRVLGLEAKVAWVKYQ